MPVQSLLQSDAINEVIHLFHIRAVVGAFARQSQVPNRLGVLRDGAIR
jgi:hypothetical protein